jgi:hypothetical protein
VPPDDDDVALGLRQVFLGRPIDVAAAQRTVDAEDRPTGADEIA